MPSDDARGSDAAQRRHACGVSAWARHWRRVSGPLREGWRISDDAPLMRERARLVARNVQAAAWSYVLVVVLLVASMSRTAAFDSMLVWGAVAVAVALLVERVMRRLPEREIEARRQGHVLMLCTGTLGLVSGLVAIPLALSGSEGAILFAAVVLAGVCAGELAYMGSFYPAFMAFVVPQVLPLIGLFFWLGEPGYFVALGWAALFYIGCLGLFGLFAQDVILQGIRLRFENLALIDRLQRESEALAHAREVAEEANRAKSRFLAAASHDLRQPLHALGLFLETLSHAALPPRETDIVGHARSASGAAHQMLNTLLDFSRLDAGVIPVQPRAFALDSLLAKLRHEFEPLAQAKGLRYRAPPTRLTASADPALVELIARNLIANAIRYTDYGGLLVGARLRGGCVLLEVWDTVMGIAPEHHAEIFREFQQLGNPERDRRKGLGLGLAIVEGLCNTMGTHVELRSEVGRGSMFRLTLPCGERGQLEPVPVVVPATPARLQGARVLMVDYDATVRLAVCELLADWGCACVAVDTLDEAQVAAQQGAPDLLIVDYRLRGEQTGAHVISALRQVFGRDLPAIIVTGDTAPTRLREAQAVDAVLLHKPLQAQALLRSMNALLARRLQGQAAG